MRTSSTPMRLSRRPSRQIALLVTIAGVVLGLVFQRGPQSVTLGGTLTGRVIAVADGDSVSVLTTNRTEVNIRLYGIDAPERNQAHADTAAAALAAKVLFRNVLLEVRDKDMHGRIVADVRLDDRWINREMVAEGHAWHYRRYADSPELAAAERAARDAKAGLWSANRPTPPWEYRRAHARR